MLETFDGLYGKGDLVNIQRSFVKITMEINLGKRFLIVND